MEEFFCQSCKPFHSVEFKVPNRPENRGRCLACQEDINVSKKRKRAKRYTEKAINDFCKLMRGK